MASSRHILLRNILITCRTTWKCGLTQFVGVRAIKASRVSLALSFLYSFRSFVYQLDELNSWLDPNLVMTYVHWIFRLSSIFLFLVCHVKLESWRLVTHHFICLVLIWLITEKWVHSFRMLECLFIFHVSVLWILNWAKIATWNGHFSWD